MPRDPDHFRINLASRIRRPSRRPIVLANIAPTQAQASDLFAIYARMIAAWRESVPRILAEYERTLAQMRTDSASSTGGEIDSVADLLQRLILQLTPDLRQWALRVEQVQRGRWVSNVLSATSIDLSTILSPFDVEDTVEASVNWNVALVRDVSEETRRRIANSVFTGFQQRKPAAVVAKEMSETIGLARSRARRIAADQTVKLGSRLNRARQEQAGLTSFVWVHSGKAHPRPWHLARNGKTYKWANPGIPADDMPGIPPFCACTARGTITFDDEE